MESIGETQLLNDKGCQTQTEMLRLQILGFDDSKTLLYHLLLEENMEEDADNLSLS